MSAITAGLILCSVMLVTIAWFIFIDPHIDSETKKKMEELERDATMSATERWRKAHK